MSTASQLQQKRCLPCEGGVEPLSPQAASELLASVPPWSIEDSGKAIFLKRSFNNFLDAMAFLNAVANLAESEQHHPDLHLTGYRKVRIELTTHAIGGLSENDFILAAKINQL
jgi:4a-hydroxytetrahydrobiopterin dehydratase